MGTNQTLRRRPSCSLGHSPCSLGHSPCSLPLHLSSYLPIPCSLLTPDYIHQQRHFEHQFTPRGPSIFNNDLVGIASYNIFVGIAVATVFGAGFFFDLFWPERAEAGWVKRAWKASAVAVCAMVLADALAMTVIVAMRSAHLEGYEGLVGGLATAQEVLSGLRSPNPPLGE